jgi:CRISPR/Cas system Type II protein with McrA/HNH and RuvC-like nuclease domain
VSEGNGNRDTRLDRIERALELLIADHEQFRHDHKQLLTAQVLQKDAIDKLYEITKEQTRQIGEHSRKMRELQQHGSAIDDRIAALVSAIGKMIPGSPGPLP